MNQGAQNNSDIRLVIAGPGGGKTHNMVGEILNSIETLAPTRHCAVITYTNAATENIKARIENKIAIPQNIFIGTTHSFLIKFIFEPFAHLFDIAPVDKHYIDSAKLPYSLNNVPAAKRIFVQKAKEIEAVNNLLDKGIVTYDKILEQSFHLLMNEAVLKAVSNRLQYVFIDEYQDSRVYQHKIIQKIIEQGRTKLYCIGDPLQSIFRFTYTQSQLRKEPKPNSFQETPLLKLCKEKKDETVFITENFRSSTPIVTLINKFIVKYNSSYQQEAKGVNSGIDYPVVFLKENEIKKLIEEYNACKQFFEIVDEDERIAKNLFLSDEWSLFEGIASENKLNRLVKDNSKPSSQLGEVMQLATAMIGLKKREIISITADELTYRKFSLKVFRAIRKRVFNDDAHCENSIRKMFQDEFKIELKKETKGKVQTTRATENIKIITSNNPTTDFYSTIHTAKGLEATSVLVCAKTQNQLLKWLAVDQILSDDDDFRLGYVAFSRARKFLAIACLQPVDLATLNIIKSLGIELSTEINIDTVFNSAT
ncbi:MAG: UvrD-helicase domain-containing protein [Limnohabitans sp.]|nr:UvrD-helicase domain-containing protein [Limnohabitans sp.]